MVALPTLDGVDHKYVDLGDGVTIHVADAGPADGPPVMLVHGFPENWWEWCWTGCGPSSNSDQER
jgi:pimeloyl-ACP methyl ester carboxylesterase